MSDFPANLGAGAPMVRFSRVSKRYGDSEHSLTMLMVTHQMGFAREISDRVCFFHSGRIEEQGPPAQIFGEPQSPRTRQFLSAILEAR